MKKKVLDILYLVKKHLPRYSMAAGSPDSHLPVGIFSTPSIRSLLFCFDRQERERDDDNGPRVINVVVAVWCRGIICRYPSPK